MLRKRNVRDVAAMVLVVLSFTAGLSVSPAASDGAEWQPHVGWGPYPPAYPYSRDAIAAGVAAGIAGSAAGQVLTNSLLQPQPRPASPPSSVYIVPPAPPVANPSAPAPSFPITAGVYSPEWNAYCASKYPGYDPQTGTYVGEDGLRQYCQ